MDKLNAVMDNLSTHKAAGAAELILGAKAIPIYLPLSILPPHGPPPLSPDGTSYADSRTPLANPAAGSRFSAHIFKWYQKARKKGKGRILDEYAITLGYNRDYVQAHRRGKKRLGDILFPASVYTEFSEKNERAV